MSRLGPDPTSTNTHEFETERLHVDLPRPEDASHLYALTSDTGWGGRTGDRDS